ncbi:MAG: hypothetical protein IKC14_05290 [Kiritimatiellae bacterium]|nr:hypothetical protein [Kiritimatiellia bacterium]
MKSLVICLLSFVLLARADETSVTDGEVWNEGVEYFRNNDVTNALRVLRPLMLSKTHGARAAEVVAKLEYDRGNLEEAAGAAQIALQAAPEDAKANRNFTRATDGLPEARETRRINAILQAAQGKDPGAMLLAATKDARQLMAEAGSYRTNAPARAVALADALAKRAEKLADTWIPVREVIAQSVTNEEQAATIIQQISEAQTKTKGAAKELGDLGEGGYAAMSDVEHDLTRFLKLTVMPPAAVDEGLLSQSNAWQDVEDFNGRKWQQDALDYTRAFRSKFPAWAQAYEQQAQSDTNKPPFTKEAQDRISALATELEKLQIECCSKALPPSQEKAIDILNEIRELLPKDNSSQSSQQSQQSQSPQDQNRQQNQNQDQQQQNQNQDQQSEQKQDQDPNRQRDQDKPDDQSRQEEEKEEDQELEATLKKAQERNDEHEAEKKARMRKAPLPPNERDW